MLSPTAPQEGLHFARRVVMHVDLDCFYVQVEQKRLGIPAGTPCAVQQWQGLIAVNYEARAAGITRHMRVAQAKKQCPELVLVHVQTIGDTHAADASTPAAAAQAASSDAAAAQAGSGAAGATAAAAGGGDVEGSARDRGSSKACLQRYRRASADIMRLLSQLCPGCLLEKASIDEAYLDITSLAMRELAAAEGAAAEGAEDEHEGPGGGRLCALLSAAAAGSVVLGGGGLQQDMEYDRLAAAGAVIALRLRSAVLAQLGFTASAGIGPNKLLAKIGSAANKPNKQTVVLPRAVEGLMQSLPLGKVKGLGGKLGAALEALGADTAGAAAALPWDTLVAHFGSKARWVFNAVRGIDDEPVTPKDKVKSINSCKSFEATSDMATVGRWLGILSAELAERMGEDEAEHARRARSLVLQYRGGPATAAAASSSRGVTPDRSIRGPMPSFNPKDSPNPDVIAAAALALFKRVKPAPWPLLRLALVATEFVDLPGSAGAAAGSGSALARFLAAGSNEHHKQQQQQAGNIAGHPSPPRPQGKHGRQQQQQQLDQFLLQGKQRGNHPSQQQQQQACNRQAGQPIQQQQLLLRQLGQQQQQCALMTTQQDQVAGQLPEHDHQPQQQQQQETCAQQQQQQQQQQQEHDPGPSGHSLEQQQHEHVPVNPRQQPEEAAAAAGRSATEAAGPVVAAAAAPDVPLPATDQLLLGVDVAEQARILRDIEIKGLIQRRHQTEHAAGSSSNSNKKRQQPASSRGPTAKKQDNKGGKQMSISALFGNK